MLKESGFKPAVISKATEAPSYTVHEPTGAAAFNYIPNRKAAKVTECDPPIKKLGVDLGKARYNIVTGGLQEWY